jgi:hypothetical protein
MTDHQQFEEMKAESSRRGKDPKTRKLLVLVLVLWLITLIALVVVWMNAYFNEKAKTLTLAEQVALACAQGDLGPGLDPDDLNPGLSPEDEKVLCENAEKVIENSGEIQEGEVQESEIQEDEIQEDEIQEREIQEREIANAERQDEEVQQDEEQEREIQDDEIQNEEIQDDEIQNEEIDNPDPNDPPAREGTYRCPDGQVMQGFTFHGDGTITYECVDNVGTPPQGEPQ